MPYNKKAVLKANTEAIRIILRLDKEQRLATEDEQQTLRAYQGFGGLKCILNRTDTPEDMRYWSKSEQDLFAPTCALKQLIFQEAASADMAKRYWESIKASVLTAFYTDTRIVSALASALEQTDVPFRSCLDPSLGMGAFADTFASRVGRVDALEKDLLTARIQQALHPQGKSKVFVRQMPFEGIEDLAEKDKYDLITSNIPFGNFMVYDRAYARGKDVTKKSSTSTIHNYFFIKGLDCIKEGGVLAFITSQGLLDAPQNKAYRRYLMENSRLVSAVRLPSGMFSESAGTEVGSDLIILQKQSGKGIHSEMEHKFVETIAVPSGDGFSMAFNHNGLFEGSWEEVMPYTIATERKLGTDPYGKATWVYSFDGDISSMAESLRLHLTHDIESRFDKKLYQTGIPMAEDEKQAEAQHKLRKLGVTAGLPKEQKKEEPAPEGVPALTLFHQCEEKAEKRIDVEEPREMNGQTVYFDEDHHPIMDTANDNNFLFAPEEYTLWTQEVERVSAELKANTPKKTQTKPKAKPQTKSKPKKAIRTDSEPSLFDFINDSEDTPPPVVEVKQAFDASPRPFLSAPDSHLRDGSIVLQKGQVGFLSDLKRQPTFHPMDLPLSQLTRLKSYIEIRECYHRLYDAEASNHSEDKEEREKLNRLYDSFVARWGAFNKKANTDIIKMDATGVEMLYLERSQEGQFVKADIFDHPTAFSLSELTILQTP